MTHAVVAVPSGDTLGESCCWSVAGQALYWVDIRRAGLHRFDPATQAHRSWALPALCGGVVLMPQGVMLAQGHALVRFCPETGALAPWRDVEPAALGNRVNEMRVDRQGRLWVGTMRDFAAATTGALYRVSPAGAVERVLQDITIPNSLGWSPDGYTLYFADTAEEALRAYTFDPRDGSLGAMRHLSAAGALPGRPDGCAVDADGHVWSTRFGAGLVVRIAPDGRVSDTIELPTSQPTCCALGGSDLRTLFITTARQRLDDDALRAQPAAGHLFAARVEVPGIVERVFDPIAAPVQKVDQERYHVEC